jgi:oligopeptide/dipeptide ABC transporter ATP-binding protein
MAEEKLIDIQNLTIKTQSGRILVNNISLDMEKGELLGVVGESGSGKTLTAKTVISLLPENLIWAAEKFEVLGVDYLTADRKVIRALVGEKIGYVPQNTGYYLHPMIKIKNQIADGYMLWAKSSSQDALERASKLVSAVGIRDTERLLDSYPWQLSGGMRQRVNIAMALMNKPRLIIADEPTTALDSTIQKQVVDLFKAVNAAHDTSVLMISHDLGLIKYYCQRILVMYAGQVMEEASTEELFDLPKHPYTKALIKVIPSLNIKKGERLEEIPGHVPDMKLAISGCVFRERCSYRQDICAREIKEQFINQNHRFRCNFDL